MDGEGKKRGVNDGAGGQAEVQQDAGEAHEGLRKKRRKRRGRRREANN